MLRAATGFLIHGVYSMELWHCYGESKEAEGEDVIAANGFSSSGTEITIGAKNKSSPSIFIYRQNSSNFGKMFKFSRTSR